MGNVTRRVFECAMGGFAVHPQALVLTCIQVVALLCEGGLQLRTCRVGRIAQTEVGRVEHHAAGLALRVCTSVRNTWSLSHLRLQSHPRLTLMKHS